jgi:hypothetical protein
MFAIGALVLTLAADAGAGSAAMPACIHFKAESRYVPYGYNHVVVIENGCSKPAACVVSTDVVPQPQNVDVPAGKSAEVTTFMGSPQQSFTPKVRCNLR